MKKNLFFLFTILILTKPIVGITSEVGKSYLNKIENNLHTDRNRAKSLISEAELFFQKSPNPFLQSQLLNLQAHIFILERELIDALKKVRSSREMAIFSKNKLQEAESYRKEGIIFHIVGNFSSSQELLLKSLKMHQELKSEFVLNNLHAICNSYQAMGKPEKVIEYANWLIQESSSLNDQSFLVDAKTFIGAANSKLGNYSDAEQQLLEALHIGIEIQTPYLGVNYFHLAELKVRQKQYSDALNYSDLHKQSDTKFNIVNGEIERLLLRASILNSLDRKDFVPDTLSEAYKMSKSQNSTKYQRESAKQLANYYQSIGKLQEALNFQKIYADLTESIFNDKQTLQSSLSQVGLDIEVKNQQIKQLQLEKEQQEQLDQLQLLVMMLSGGSGILLVFLYTKALRSRKKLRVYADELKQATEAKSSFLARMSHEIRTPINAILGLTKLTQRTALDEHQRENLGQILDSSHTLLGVINDILDFSKIEAGKLTLESVPFTLDQIVKQSLKLNNLKSQEKSLELVQYVAPDVPLELIGDPLRVQQVLNNLLSNAVKFTDKGIVSLQVNKKFHHMGLKLEFIVKDSGIGISQQQQDRLFQSFNQADESTSRKFGGTGLGLSICKQLVEMMGGDIWVESQIGEGSSFHFTIVIEENTDSVVEPISSEQLAKLRVLVVDDIELSRRSLAEALVPAGINPDLAANGNEAIDKIRLSYTDNKPYNLIIMDWQMPELDGLQVAAIINQEFSQQPPKILMISAYDMEKVKELGKPLGISHYVEKPINGSDLINYLMSIESGKSLAGKTVENDFTAPNLEKLQILLVEDNELNRKVAKGFLKDTGANITVAENGFIALDMLQRYPTFDLILMDIQMPEMDGLTATNKIRKELEINTPIIAMTAQAMTGDKEKCLAVGMNDYITKPINPEKLFAALNKYADVVSEKEVKIINEVSKLASERPPWLQAVDRIKDIDLDTSLAAFKGDTELYRGLVSDFVSAYLNINSDVDNYRKLKDHDAVYRIVHSLKSSSSYIGAIALAHAATFIEQQLKEKLDCELELQQLINSTRQLTKQLQLALDVVEESVKQDNPCRDTAHIEGLLEQLSNMLYEADAASEGLAEEIYLCFKETPQQALAKRIYNDTRDFEFEAAQASLNQLMEAKTSSGYFTAS